LQHPRLAAHQPQADELETQAFDHRLDDVGQAAVDGGFGNEIGHAVQKQKSGPSGPPVTFGSFRFGPRSSC